jgi:hypothetical protein
MHFPAELNTFSDCSASLEAAMEQHYDGAYSPAAAATSKPINAGACDEKYVIILQFAHAFPAPL